MKSFCVIGLAVLSIASIASAQPALQGATGDGAMRLLAAHNKERAAVGAPPLQWNQDLADHAASYGPTLASLRRMVHSPREGRPGERENLAMAWHGTRSLEQLVDMWSEERQLLVSGSYLFPAMSRTGRWQDIAHYTQMVWPTTTHVGCAIFAADWDYLICRYSPPGNEDGKPIFVTTASASATDPKSLVK